MPNQMFSNAENNRIIIVSNRSPISDFKKGLDSMSVGGLTSALHRVAMESRATWVFAIDAANSKILSSQEPLDIGYDLSPVLINEKEYKAYYSGYSNSLIWPLFHYFPDKCVFKDDDWVQYKAVNEKFACHIAEIVKDDPKAVIWIQDYHLFLVAQHLRKLNIKNSIGFFLHIPFPTYEIFRLLPQREEVLTAFLSIDLIGFHTRGYVTNFCRSLRRLVKGVKIEEKTGNEPVYIEYQNQRCSLKNFPISVDAEMIMDLLETPKVKAKTQQLANLVGSRLIGLGVDRLDYSKGIVQKLKSLDCFFRKHPKYRNKVSFIQIAVPSRGQVLEYQKFKDEVEQTISKINGQYGNLDWQPIIYINRSVPFQTLISYYQIADFALITPLRDGMNLVAKEFIIARKEDSSLILSELAGAAEILSNVYLVNPYNHEQIADTVNFCLENPGIQNRILNRYKSNLVVNNVHKWAKEIIKEIIEINGSQISKQPGIPVHT